jgi:hypothetical protein
LSEPLPLIDAARELDIAPSTLRRWIASGAPCARRGSRGRGRCTLVDPAALDAWRRAQTAEAQLLALAADLPELLADAIYALAMSVDDGQDKRRVFGALVSAWYAATTTALDRIRLDAPAVADVSALPQKIRALRLILDDAGIVPRTTPKD